MRWLIVSASLALAGGATARAWVLPEREERTVDWCAVVLKQPLTITEEDFAKLREKVLADPFLRAASDPATDLRDKPAAEAIAALRERLRQPDATSSLHLILGDRLWEHYSRTGDVTAGKEAAESWQRWAAAETSDPARPLRLARRFAELELWEAAVPMLRQAARRCPPESVAELRDAARLFQRFRPEIEAAFAVAEGNVGDEERLKCAVVAWEVGAKDLARRLLAKLPFIPASYRGLLVKLRGEFLRAGDDALSLRALVIADQASPGDPAWEVAMARKIAGLLGPERGALVDGAVAQLRKGGVFTNVFDYLLAAACAGLENRSGDVSSLLAAQQKAYARFAPSPAIGLFRAEQAAKNDDAMAWKEAFKSLSPEVSSALVDVAFGAVRQGESPEKLQSFFEGVADEVKSGIGERTPGNLGRTGLWCLLAGRISEAAKQFEEGLAKSNRVDDRLALAYGLAVARQQSGDDDAAVRTFGGFPQDKTGALLLALVVDSSVPEHRGLERVENLLPQAFKLARAEDRTEEAGQAARSLRLESRWRRLDGEGDWFASLDENSDFPEVVNRVRREWPMSLSRAGQGRLAHAVAAHLAEFEPFLKDLVELHAATAPVIQLKFGLGRQLGDSSSDRSKGSKESMEWSLKLLWSAYDDAAALETIRAREVDSRKEIPPPGSLESGLWRHRFGEWNESWHPDWGSQAAPRTSPWETPMDTPRASPSAGDIAPTSSLHVLRGLALREMRSRLDRTDSSAVDTFRDNLYKRLDDAKAGLDERLAMLRAANLMKDLLETLRAALDGGRLNVEQGARSLAATRGFMSFFDGDGAGYRRGAELQYDLAGWLLDRADRWPEDRKTQWLGEVQSFLPGSGPRAAEYSRHLTDLRSAIGQAKLSGRSSNPLSGWLDDLNLKSNRSGALDQLERAVRGGANLSAQQSTGLAHLAVSWLFGDSQTRGAAFPTAMGVPLGLSPLPDMVDLDPDSAARGLVLASTAWAKEDWQPAPPAGSGDQRLIMRERDRWLPHQEDTLPGTRFLPAIVLLSAARMENISPVTLSDWRRAPYSHECRYQNLVRWLDEQARVHTTPEDVPFRLLALQFRWTGGERRAAALLAWDWFRLSPYPDLRHVACQLLQQTTYDHGAATLALGLLGSADFPADRAMALFTKSIARLPAAEREGPIKKLAELDGMKALLASVAISRAAAVKPTAAGSSTARQMMRPEPAFPMPFQPNTDVAADRRFLEALTYNGREACTLFEEALKSNWPRGGPEIDSPPTAGVERKMRWARLLQSAHWLESTGMRYAAPRTGGDSVKKNNPDANKVVATDWAESETTGVFLDMLRASEPAGGNPVWKQFPPVQALEPPCWLRLVRMEDKAGDAVYRFEISKNGDQWREVGSARWPHPGQAITLGIANLSGASVPYEGWKFDGFKTPDPSHYTWTRGGAVPGKLSGYRHYGTLKPLPPSGTLPEWPGDDANAFGDAFYGLGRHVIGEGSMVVRLEAAPPGGRAGVFIQKDWFAGGTRIMATLDAAGQFEMTQRLGRTDGVDLLKELAATEAERGGAAWWMRRYLLALVELRLDEEAWSAAGKLGDRELVRLMVFGCADMLATIHSTSPSRAAAFADRLLELGGALPDDPGVRNCMEIAFRILAGKLPGETAGDRRRNAAVDAFLGAGAGDRRRNLPRSRKGESAEESLDLASSLAPRTIEVAPGAAPSPREALDTLIAASRENVPRSPAPNRTSQMGLSLLDTCYHPDTGLLFTLVQKSLSLRGTAEATAALEEYPWQSAASTDPPPDAALPDREFSGAVAQNQRFRAQLGFALRLALGEAETARALPESLTMFLPMPLGLPPVMAKQVLANCLHAGGFENDAITMQRELLQEINKPWPECWGFSFDVPLRLALWSKDRSARGNALDQFVALVRRQKRAAPYDPMFRLAIRKGAELLRKDRRDKEAKELEGIANAAF